MSSSLIFGLASLAGTFLLGTYISQVSPGRPTGFTLLAMGFPAYLLLPLATLLLGVAAFYHGTTAGIICGILGILFSLMLLLGLAIGG